MKVEGGKKNSREAKIEKMHKRWREERKVDTERSRDGEARTPCEE